jgi:hypothetical protein
MSDPHIITELYAFIATETDEGEGIPAVQLSGMMMPLVGADAARVETLRKMAQQVADGTGRTLTLARFAVRENMATITPRKQTP